MYDNVEYTLYGNKEMLLQELANNVMINTMINTINTEKWKSRLKSELEEKKTAEFGKFDQDLFNESQFKEPPNECKMLFHNGGIGKDDKEKWKS